MRVLVVLSSLYTGGAEFSTLLFYQWCKKNNHEVRLVCFKKANPQYEAAKFDFADYTTLAPGTFLQKLKELNRIIADFQPQIVHSVLFEANMLARFSKVFTSGIVYLESLVNETYSDFRLHDPKVKWYKLRLYQYFDAITQLFGVTHFHANSISVADHYKSKLKVRSSKMTVVPRGRSANPFVGNVMLRREIRTSLGIPDDAVVFINVGRHEFQKGHDILIEATARLDANSRCIVVVAGREGNNTNTIKKSILDKSVQDRIKLIGHRTDISQLLAAADVFVFPSRFEGLPGALIEAEAAALPLIASEIPNNHEVAEAGNNAFFFALNDPEKLAGYMATLADNKVLREKMGKESLVIFEKRFSIEEVHSRMEVLLLKLLNGK